MKSERRHELKESDLAHALEQGKGYMQQHGAMIGLGAIAVVAVVAVAGFVIRSRTADVEDRWFRHSQLTYDTPEATRSSLQSLLAMADETSDREFALSALMDAGRRALQGATSDSDVADPELNDFARQAFERVVERFSDNPLTLGIAHLGLATVEENEFSLDRDATHRQKAMQHLKAVTENKQAQSLPLYQTAMDRLEVIDKTFRTVVFLASAPKDPEETKAPAPPTPGPPPGVKPIPLQAKTGSAMKIQIGPDGKATVVEEMDLAEFEKKKKSDAAAPPPAETTPDKGAEDETTKEKPADQP